MRARVQALSAVPRRLHLQAGSGLRHADSMAALALRCVDVGSSCADLGVCVGERSQASSLPVSPDAAAGCHVTSREQRVDRRPASPDNCVERLRLRKVQFRAKKPAFNRHAGWWVGVV
mmetsp:Transcript_12229/g.37487  ORF Transcript_12229/g.37487 Transcript_12229/m.37487 type:complete len:118 (+) Transcript_12229:270-623(+)